MGSHSYFIAADVDTNLFGSWSSATIGKSFFPTNTFFINTGLTYVNYRAEFPQEEENGIGINLRIGNEWKVGYSVIGADWIGGSYCINIKIKKLKNKIMKR